MDCSKRSLCGHLLEANYIHVPALALGVKTDVVIINVHWPAASLLLYSKSNHACRSTRLSLVFPRSNLFNVALKSWEWPGHGDEAMYHVCGIMWIKVDGTGR